MHVDLSQSRVPDVRTWESILERRKAATQTLERITSRLDQAVAEAEERKDETGKRVLLKSKRQWTSLHAEMESGFGAFYAENMKGPIAGEDLCVVAQAIEPILYAIEQAGATLK